MKRSFLLVVALILYGSLYPWEFHGRELPANPLWILLHTPWPGVMNRYFLRDFLVNVALYIPYGVFGFLALGEKRSAWIRAGLTIASAAVLSSCVEMLQLFDANRSCGLSDVACNTAGACAGSAIAALLSRRIRGAVDGAEAAGAFRFRGAMLLIYLWAAYQMFPFFPDFTRVHFNEGVAAIVHPRFTAAVPLLLGFGMWIALGALLDEVLPRAAARNTLVLLTAVFPFRLLLLDREIRAAEILGAGLGIAAWLMALRRRGHPGAAAGFAVLAAVVVSGLSPYRFTAEPQLFSWIPFAAVLDSPWSGGFVILLQKSFLYGSAIWLLRRRWGGWVRTTFGVAVTLGVVEGIQTWLPGRTPESTDPILALLIATVLVLSRRAKLGKPKVGSAA